MSSIKTPVIIPSEVQAREFDAKLLLACFLAEVGVVTYIGARHEIHANIHRLPRSLYVAKDFRKPSNRIFGILDRLGHKIVAWDEEGLLPLKNPEVYYTRRVMRSTIALVREFYAWGDPNKYLIEHAPGYPGVPVHSAGNPRIDLLRPELRGFHKAAADKLKDQYGDFILVNTNFGTINNRVPSQNMVPGQPDPTMDEASKLDFDNLLRHRLEMFDVLRGLLPRLARRFTDRTIILRPHPVEDKSVWRQAAHGQDNVEVTDEGPVLPWLLAAQVMIHNGCTTGLEAFLLDSPAIMFEPKDVESVTTRMLSDVLSHHIDSEQKLFDTVAQCLDTGRSLPQHDSQWQELEKIVSATKGPLASERIAGHICDILRSDEFDEIKSLKSKVSGHLRSRKRRIEKSVAARWPGHRKHRSHNEQRYPGLSFDEVTDKVGSLSQVLGRFQDIQIRPVQGQIFRLEKNG